MANQIFDKNRLKTKGEAPELVQHFCRKPDLRFHIAENRSGFIANIGGEEYDINIKFKFLSCRMAFRRLSAKFEYRRIKETPQEVNWMICCRQQTSIMKTRTE